jgi:hypothetical protein
VPTFTFGYIATVLYHSLLPGLSIILAASGFWALAMRGMMVTTQGEDFMILAEAKGLKGWRILTRYALRNCYLPQITAFGISLGFIFNGNVLVEQLFNYPGLGTTLVTAIQQRPGPLTAALAQTPVTFLHGDWKMGNLGEHPDGRTILVDCAYPGSGPPCWDLMWYLALNRARLPVAKAEVIAQFRAALERRGWDTEGWFGRQLALCQLGMISTFGWEKALGAGDPAGAAELDWWQQRALAAARELAASAPGWRDLR